uniref:hybrid sensor histidine kinase/response regulator n=1 Tax=uncultured Caulobacter sp. TaxID=158749 RepID=UPI0025D98F5B|nr:hybrid sensor histidine kinase/response regulator [uncultured Caulobacter sp.]
MSALRPVHFLLVDDLAENLVSLEALLRREDLVLLKARSGEEALELLLRHDVALALLDVQMPGMDGFELAEFMRGAMRTRHVPIIFLTAGTAADAQRRFRGYEAGAVDFINKPIEPDVLRSKANVFFDLYRQRQQLERQRDELEAAAQALRRADRHKDSFLAVLAHELRNPIAALAGGLHLLGKDIPVERSTDIRARMDRMLSHLSHLVDDLLDVSRVNEGKITLKKARIELSEILTSAIESSQHHMDQAGHKLVTDLETGPIWLDADHTRLAQVIGNLLNNAAKYTPPGGTVTLSAHRRDGVAEIRVSDTGVGIPAEMQAGIFEIFAQVEDHLSKSQGGLGIGLALCKQLVALHGGTIDVASAGLNKGSTFTVIIPLARDAG